MTTSIVDDCNNSDNNAENVIINSVISCHENSNNENNNDSNEETNDDHKNNDNNRNNNYTNTSISGEGTMPVDEALTVVEVGRLMREQDAELLESMHLASTKASQYSPGGTPILRPQPIVNKNSNNSMPPADDLPMIPGAAITDDGLRGESSTLSTNTLDSKSVLYNVMRQNSSSTSTAKTLNNIYDKSNYNITNNNNNNNNNIDSTSAIIDDRRNDREDHSGQFQKESSSITSFLSGDINALAPTQPSLSDKNGILFQRCLSGEIRPRPVEQNNDQLGQQVAEEEETTASPISVTQEVAASLSTHQQQNQQQQQHQKNQHQQERGSGLERQRRMSEAIQFAEAVGEMPNMRQDEFRIIEGHTDDEDSDDDEDQIRRCKIPMETLDEEQSIQTCQQSLDGDHLPELVDAYQTTNEQQKRKSRPLWPFGRHGTESSFLDKLSEGLNDESFVYKGICANPPEITKHGISRGNYAQLHRKAWLEVSDKYHRYGKNLRLYYRYWERLGFPTNMFFDWLDSKGEAAGQPLPNLEECSRAVLDSDTVLYITNPKATAVYALHIVPNEEGRGRVLDVDHDPVITGPEGWIFVLRDNVLYGARKVTSITGHSKQRFHHSSFFGGKAVAAAGILITDADGYLTRLYPHSGHYRPGEAHMQRMLFFLHRQGVDLRTFEMDTQQFRHVAREKEMQKSGKNADGEKTIEKKKKVDSLHLEVAVMVACFLAHKANFIGKGIFDQIHMIRKAPVTNVTEALESVDDGGYWPKKEEAAASSTMSL